MAIRTEESLQKLFEASRTRQQRLKEQETKKYRKAQESTKKALAKQQSKEREKASQKAQKQPQIELSRTITIYNTKYIERFIGEDDLYTSREELEDAEPNNINWELWDELVRQTKLQIYGNTKRYKTKTNHKSN